MKLDQAKPTPIKPYLIRAWHEWCCDNDLTPYLLVAVDSVVVVPREFVQNNQITLNVSFSATSHLNIGSDCIEFKARFGGVARDISVPTSHVLAIFARELPHLGMAFDAPNLHLEPEPSKAGPALKVVPKTEPSIQELSEPSPHEPASVFALKPEPPAAGLTKPKKKPSLKRVK